MIDDDDILMHFGGIEKNSLIHILNTIHNLININTKNQTGLHRVLSSQLNIWICYIEN